MPKPGVRLVTVGNPLQYTRDGTTHDADNQKLQPFWEKICSVFEKNSKKNETDNYYQRVMAAACQSDIKSRKNSPPIVPYDTRSENKTTFEELERIYFSTGTIKSTMDYHIITDVDGMSGFSGGPMVDILRGSLLGISVLTVQPLVANESSGNRLDFSSVPSFLVGEILKPSDLIGAFNP